MRKATHILLVAVCLLPLEALAGLDVTAYADLVKVAHPVVDQEGQPQDWQHQVLLRPVDFPERFKGLEPGAIYVFGESREFEAGSYSGYNGWRNELARLAGYPLTDTESPRGKPEKRYDAGAWAAKSGPFWELINFSDAQGVLGPVVCKKLYADFLAYHRRAMAHPDAAFVESYKEWEQAFKMAARNGAVSFH